MREIPKKIQPLEINTLVVDATYLMKQSFTATENSSEYENSKGRFGGIYMFMMTLRQLANEINPNKIILAWDGINSGKLRYNIYPLYKANRESKDWYGGEKKNLSEAQMAVELKTKRSMRMQRNRVNKYCEELYCRQIEVDLIEADDIVAAYCQLYHTTEKITIYTNDRDYCSLLEYDNVSICLAKYKSKKNKDLPMKRNLVISKENYFLYFEHHYSNACLVKAIVGDTGDNIYGIVGLGEPTLLKHFPELKKRKMTYQEIVEGTKQKQEGRTKKEGPLKVFQNIIEGVTTRLTYGEYKPVALGNEFYELNLKLVDLMQPMVNQQAMDVIHQYSESFLDSDDRGAARLRALMNEDYFLVKYNNTVTDYVQPFVKTVMREKAYEKQMLNE